MDQTLYSVRQVSALTGVSVRTLHYYDQIGLLSPDRVTQAGYRLYGDAALQRMQCILLFRELEFPLREIRRILDADNFDVTLALRQQAQLLRLKKQRLEALIDLAQRLQTGGTEMDFSAFDTSKLDDYAAQARAAWGDTPSWQEFEKKAQTRDAGEEQNVNAGLMRQFEGFGALRGQDPAGPALHAQVQALRDYLTANYYTCTPQILQGLGAMYAAGGEMTENIDRAGGQGTAQLAAQAIQAYCEDLG